jgi:hypothetical protein
MQDGQTQGLPIGPDTSYILSELLSSAIDAEFESVLGEELIGCRLIDDYVLFFESTRDAERAQAALIRATRGFQGELNPEKTRVLSIFDETRESWTYKLAEYRSGDGVEQQRRALIKYADQAISLFHQCEQSSIGRYAIKAISNEVVHPKNLDVALSCVMRLSQISPSSIIDFAKFVNGYDNIGFRYSKEPIKRYVLSTLRRSLGLGHDCEAAWCLWLAIRIKIKIPKDIVKEISRSEASPILLLGKVAEAAKLCDPIEQNVFGSTLNEDDFISANWLLAYEGAMRGWFGWKRSDVDGSLLEILARRDIYFLNLTGSEKSILKRRANPATENALDFFEINFDELDDLFETDVSDDGYDLLGRDDDDGEDEGDGDDEDSEDDEVEGRIRPRRKRIC